jgi:hypothetical protein
MHPNIYGINREKSAAVGQIILYRGINKIKPKQDGLITHLTREHKSIMRFGRRNERG